MYKTVLLIDALPCYLWPITPFLTLPSSKPIILLHLAVVNDDEMCAEYVPFTSPHCYVTVSALIA